MHELWRLTLRDATSLLPLYAAAPAELQQPRRRPAAHCRVELTADWKVRNAQAFVLFQWMEKEKYVAYMICFE